MAPRKVVAIGIGLAEIDNVDELEFDSNHSLLDWDVVVFSPVVTSMLQYGDTYQGKTSLSEGPSFRLKERSLHWRRELKQALESGRTAICYLPTLQEIWVDSGKRTFSGTGRNQKTTRMVEPYNNFECLPFEFTPRSSIGTSMKLSARASVLAPYWSEFRELCSYQVILQDTNPTASVQTKTGDLVVGGIFRSQGGGNFVALPMLDFWNDQFFDDDGNFDDEGKTFAAKLLGAWLALDTALRADSDVTPEPQWAQDPIYSLGEEVDLQAKLLEAESKLEQAQREKDEVSEALSAAGSLRALLYEKGTPLETAIIRALVTLGFRASPYKDNESEFDVVFESDEGRLLGEAEGKDNKAINVDKLRQLGMNISEDLARDDVATPAKPVLFGNGYRLLVPGERTDQFTEKCVSAAKASNTALVTTSSLFQIAKHVADTNDREFASSCRHALLNSSGMVVFPEPPSRTVQRDVLADTRGGVFE